MIRRAYLKLHISHMHVNVVCLSQACMQRRSTSAIVRKHEKKAHAVIGCNNNSIA